MASETELLQGELQRILDSKFPHVYNVVISVSPDVGSPARYASVIYRTGPDGNFSVRAAAPILVNGSLEGLKADFLARYLVLEDAGQLPASDDSMPPGYSIRILSKNAVASDRYPYAMIVDAGDLRVPVAFNKRGLIALIEGLLKLL